MDKDKLYDDYIVKGKPILEIIEENNISTGSLYFYLNKFDIEMRSEKKPTPYREKNGSNMSIMTWISLQNKLQKNAKSANH